MMCSSQVKFSCEIRLVDAIKFQISKIKGVVKCIKLLKGVMVRCKQSKVT